MTIAKEVNYRRRGVKSAMLFLPALFLTASCQNMLKMSRKGGPMKKAIVIIVLAFFFVTLVGCIGIQGGSDQGRAEPTLGQQLIDLKKAKDEGAITHEEYKEFKEKLKQFYD